MKRGRPRQSRPLVDLGTPEAIRRRLDSLAGHRRTPGWPEPDLTHAEAAIGRLLWNGYLGADYQQARRRYEAGVSFMGWWVVVHPMTFSATTLGRLQPGGGTAPDTTEAELRLRLVKATLARRGWDAVVNACVYQRHAAIDALVAGLDALIGLEREVGVRRAVA